MTDRPLDRLREDNARTADEIRQLSGGQQRQRISGQLGSDKGTVGILLSNDLPASWTTYIDFTATGNEPFLLHPAITLEADGDADFAGTVSATSFTAITATFTGQIVTEGGLTVQLGSSPTHVSKLEAGSNSASYALYFGATAEAFIALVHGDDTAEGGTITNAAADIQERLKATTGIWRVFPNSGSDILKVQQSTPHAKLTGDFEVTEDVIVATGKSIRVAATDAITLASSAPHVTVTGELSVTADITVAAGQSIRQGATDVATLNSSSPHFSVTGDLDASGELIGASSMQLAMVKSLVGGQTVYGPPSGFILDADLFGTVGGPNTDVAVDCVITNLTVRLATAPGAGETSRITIMHNGAASALNLLISDTDQLGTDTSTVTLAPQDRIALRYTTSGSAATSHVKVSYEIRRAV